MNCDKATRMVRMDWWRVEIIAKRGVVLQLIVLYQFGHDQGDNTFADGGHSESRVLVDWQISIDVAVPDMDSYGKVIATP